MSSQPNTKPAPEVIGGYEVHPTASLFPLLAGSDYEELKKSLADHGQQEPVIIQNGVVIDGRNRLLILRELGRPVAFHHYDGELPVDQFILTRNLHRRHLSDDQRMMIITQIMLQQETEAARARQQEAGKKHGRSRPKVGAKSTQAVRQPKVSQKIADVAKGTDYAARQAIDVVQSAPELVESVAKGSMKLKDAHAKVKAIKCPQLRHAPNFLDTKTRLICGIHNALKKYPRQRDELVRAITTAISAATTLANV